MSASHQYVILDTEGIICRVLEMQVFLADLVGKFSFTFPEEGDTIRMRLMGTLSPILPSGEKGAPLCVTRV